MSRGWRWAAWTLVATILADAPWKALGAVVVLIALDDRIWTP